MSAGVCPISPRPFPTPLSLPPRASAPPCRPPRPPPALLQGAVGTLEVLLHAGGISGAGLDAARARRGDVVAHGIPLLVGVLYIRETFNFYFIGEFWRKRAPREDRAGSFCGVRTVQRHKLCCAFVAPEARHTVCGGLAVAPADRTEQPRRDGLPSQTSSQGFGQFCGASRLPARHCLHIWDVVAFGPCWPALQGTHATYRALGELHALCGLRPKFRAILGE